MTASEQVIEVIRSKKDWITAKLTPIFGGTRMALPALPRGFWPDFLDKGPGLHHE
jgi:hypothetical protein